jgi:hypothetical protein
VIPAAPAAAISPKLEMAWVARGPPRPQTRLASPEQGDDGHGRALGEEAALGCCPHVHLRC